MTSDMRDLLLELLGGAIVIPFWTWLVVSIFGLKQQVALIRAEMGVLHEIKELLARGGRHR